MVNETKGMTIIRILNNCMIALSVVLLLQGVYTDMSYKMLSKDLIICLDVVVMHFVLRYLRSFVPFTFGCAGLLLVNYLAFASGIQNKNYDYIPVIAILLIIVILAYYAHINETLMVQPTYWGILYCILYLLLATFIRSTIPLKIGELYTVCVIVFAFIYSVLDRQDQRLVLSSDRTYVPVDRIRSSNFILMSIGSGIVFFLGIIFFVIGHGENLIRAVWNAIMAFLRFLFSNLDYEYSQEASAGDSQTGGSIDFGELVEQKDNPFLDKLWEVLSYVMAFVAVALFVFMIVAIAISFYKRFQKTSKLREKDKVEYLKPVESIVPDRHRSSNHISFIDRSPLSRIRRRYKKFIIKSPGYKDISKQMTPWEIENTAYNNTDFDNRNRIHEIYEKARYGNCEMTSKDASDFERLF